MKRIYTVTADCTIFVIILAFCWSNITAEKKSAKHIKAGFVYVNDASTAYTGNFLEAQEEVEYLYGDDVETISKYNVAEGKEAEALQELVDAGCDLIFSTSYGYGTVAKQFAADYPAVEFCQATCANANEKPQLQNYHTFMGEIYEGRYISGVAAGMKLKQLIDEGKITPKQAKAGYVAAYPYPEVISGFTAFFMGIRSVVPKAQMTVTYTDTWSAYALEKKAAQELIAEGCIIISQHSDTTGPAVACENTDKSVLVYHVGYNQSMMDIAPTTAITGCRINWKPYITAAVRACLADGRIEEYAKGHVHGNDVGAGFEKGWVEMLEVNELAAAPGTKKRIESLIKQFTNGEIAVFKGPYTGTDPYDGTDVYDLRDGYQENEHASAPSFHYILDDVITVKQ